MSVGKESIKRAASAGTRGKKAAEAPDKVTEESLTALSAETVENVPESVGQAAGEAAEAEGKDVVKAEGKAAESESPSGVAKSAKGRASAPKATRARKAAAPKKSNARAKKDTEDSREPEGAKANFLPKEEKKPGRAIRFTEELPVYLL